MGCESESLKPNWSFTQLISYLIRLSKGIQGSLMRWISRGWPKRCLPVGAINVNGSNDDRRLWWRRLVVTYELIVHHTVDSIHNQLVKEAGSAKVIHACFGSSSFGYSYQRGHNSGSCASKSASPLHPLLSPQPVTPLTLHLDCLILSILVTPRKNLGIFTSATSSTCKRHA